MRPKVCATVLSRTCKTVFGFSPTDVQPLRARLRRSRLYFPLCTTSPGSGLRGSFSARIAVL